MSPSIGRTFCFWLVRAMSILAWALPPVREKLADCAAPKRSDCEAKALPDEPSRKLVRIGPAGIVKIGPEVTNCRLPVSDLEWPVSWARRVSRATGIGPVGLTTIDPAVSAACRAL